MSFDEIKDEARRLFEKSIDDEEEKTNNAKSEDEVQKVAAYYAGWRDVLLELFPDVDVEDPNDFPLP